MISEVTYRSEVGEILAARAQEEAHPGADGTADLADVQVIRTAGRLDLLLAIVSGAVRGEVPDLSGIDTVKNATLEYIRTSTQRDVPSLLRGAVEASNQMVVSDPGLRGLGLTQVILAIQGNRLYLAQVGNSRAYLIRGDRLIQMTRDHTLAGELVRLGKALPREITESPKKNDLVRYIGKDRNIYVDTRIHLPGVDGKPYLELEPGDGVILCTNGLVERAVKTEKQHLVDGDFISFYHRQDPPAIAGMLVDPAQRDDSGAGHSVVVIKSAAEALPQPVPVGSGSCLGQIGVIGTVLIVSIVLGLIAAYAFPALMNPKPIANTGSIPAQPGFVAASQVEGQVQVFEPGQEPVDLSDGAQLEAIPGTKVMTAEGMAKLALADGAAVYVDRATLITLSTIANPRAGQMQTVLDMTGGALMVDTAHTSSGTTTQVTNANKRNAVATGTFIGVLYTPDSVTMEVDCLRGPCQIAGATASRDLETGQRSSVTDGVIGPVIPADYTRWATLCDSNCPNAQPQVPIVTPTFVPTPTPYLGAFQLTDLFDSARFNQAHPAGASAPLAPDVSAAGLVPWAILLFGGYRMGKAALNGVRKAGMRPKQNGEDSRRIE